MTAKITGRIPAIRRRRAAAATSAMDAATAMAETLTPGARLRLQDAAFIASDWLVRLPDLTKKRHHLIA